MEMRNENDVRSYPQRGSLLGVLQQLKNETLPGAFIDLEMVRPGFDFRLTGSKNYVSLFCRLQTGQFLRNADWCNCFVRYIYNPNSFSSSPGPRCFTYLSGFSEPWPIPRYGTVKYGKHSISYLGPYLWWKISQDIRSKTRLGSFVGTICNLDVTSLLGGSCKC